MQTKYPAVLTIAGSDSGGGAGIQADIKSISACGAYAASVITVTTAQNTQGVTDIHAIPIPHLEKQLDAVLSDIDFGAIKIGMLHSCEVIRVVEAKLKSHNCTYIVLDPVMVATSGDNLIDKAAIDCLKAFLPEATLITPNVPEAEILIGHKIDAENVADAAREMGQSFQTAVLLKGGHLEQNGAEIVDLLYVFATNEIYVINSPRVPTKHTHGTGCSLSSGIAAFLSQGIDLIPAVKKGVQYVNKAISDGKDKILGKGNGPINHFGL